MELTRCKDEKRELMLLDFSGSTLYLQTRVMQGFHMVSLIQVKVL